jgi:hypothetical protein
MANSFERMQERAKLAEQKQNEKTSVPACVEIDTQLELPMELLGKGARGAPDSILRSALFSATKPGKRRNLDNEAVAAVSNVTIKQTGPQLQQIDLDVWIELVRLAAETQNSVITVPLKNLLKRLDRDTGTKSRERLLSTLLRLNACLVSITYKIKDKERNYNGNMIFEHSRDEKQHLVIRLNPRIAALFDNSSWSTLQLEQRHKLKRQPLAQWLHGYYSSHAYPFPIKVETLRTLSGSTARHLRQFRTELKGAMDKVSGVTGWSWSLDSTDKLIVVKGVSTDAE